MASDKLFTRKDDSKTKKFSFSVDADLYDKFENLQKKADELGIEINVQSYFKKSFDALIKKIEKRLDTEAKSATKTEEK